MSSFEEDKARAVLDSVNDTFNGNASQLQRLANFDQSLDDFDDKAELVSEIERLFETTIPAIEREKGSTQNFLRLRWSSPKLSVNSPFRIGIDFKY